MARAKKREFGDLVVTVFDEVEEKVVLSYTFYNVYKDRQPWVRRLVEDWAMDYTGNPFKLTMKAAQVEPQFDEKPNEITATCPLCSEVYPMNEDGDGYEGTKEVTGPFGEGEVVTLHYCKCGGIVAVAVGDKYHGEFYFRPDEREL
jgi:hypothetical protein